MSEEMRLADQLEVRAKTHYFAYELGRGDTFRSDAELMTRAAAALRAQSLGTQEPVAYLHTCEKYGHEPQLGFEKSVNPDWIDTPLYASPPALVAQREALEAFDPTNHHNALKCPYCNPEGLAFATPATGGETE